MVCPKCGARSKTASVQTFGTEPGRESGYIALPLSSDPIVAKRRERARQIRKQNTTKGL